MRNAVHHPATVIICATLCVVDSSAAQATGGSSASQGRSAATRSCAPVELRALNAESAAAKKLMSDLQSNLTDHFNPTSRQDQAVRVVLSVANGALTAHIPSVNGEEKRVPPSVMAAVTQSNSIAREYTNRVTLSAPLEFVVQFRPACTALRNDRNDTARARADNPITEPRYFEFQVERTAMPRPGNPTPIYPPTLFKSGTAGHVLAQYVVGTDGRADMSTFKILESTDPLFTQAVRDAVAGMRFYPAQIEGKKVRQIVQQPFDFSVSR